MVFKPLVAFSTQSRVKESFKLLFAIYVEQIWRYKSRNSLATQKLYILAVRAENYGPLN